MTSQAMRLARQSLASALSLGPLTKDLATRVLATKAGLSEMEANDVKNGNADHIDLDRLVQALNVIGYDVLIKVSPSFNVQTQDGTVKVFWVAG